MGYQAKSRYQTFELGFPVSEYEFPSGAGAFKGILVMKKWNDSKGLICYFETDDGMKKKLMVWWNPKGDSYKPKQSDVNMQYAEYGTRWHVTYDISKKQRTIWLTAEQI